MHWTPARKLAAPRLRAFPHRQERTRPWGRLVTIRARNVARDSFKCCPLLGFTAERQA
jgi:hypothetical protein